ncbi:MAG: outer membrane beta-barrel domain-containing protein [Sandaracinaceae bacterium]
MRHRSTLLLAASFTAAAWALPSTPALLAGPTAAGAQCIDEAIRDELNARRRYRGVRERLFQKSLRHELSVLGGVYAADLLSASWMVQGAYTFHVTEDLGLEASFGYSRARSQLVSIIENEIGATLIRLDRPVFLYQGHLLWTLAYGKLRWFGSGIGRFDFNLAIGGGLTDTQTSRGLTFSAGLGIKLFFDQWFSIRLDVRNQILQQELLGSSTVVNNLTATLGMSVFIPFTY